MHRPTHSMRPCVSFCPPSTRSAAITASRRCAPSDCNMYPHMQSILSDRLIAAHSVGKKTPRGQRLKNWKTPTVSRHPLQYRQGGSAERRRRCMRGLCRECRANTGRVDTVTAVSPVHCRCQSQSRPNRAVLRRQGGHIEE